MPENSNVSVAVLLPCYNEEVTIGKVVRDFKAALPHADIYVYDNNSTDRTAEIAMPTYMSWQTAMILTLLMRRQPWLIKCLKAMTW